MHLRYLEVPFMGSERIGKCPRGKKIDCHECHVLHSVDLENFRILCYGVKPLEDFHLHFIRNEPLHTVYYVVYRDFLLTEISIPHTMEHTMKTILPFLLERLTESYVISREKEM